MPAAGVRGAGPAEWPAARGQSGFAGLSVRPLVRKVRRTAGQRTLARDERQRNLEGAFAFTGADTGAGLGAAEAVVLVDDVYTTGATAEAVSRVVHSGTGLPVLVFTFARTPAPLAEGIA
jgi:predicted amidophosphoribosyltransferase